MKRALKNKVKKESVKKIDDDVMFVKKIPQYPRERRKCKLDKKYFCSKRYKQNKLDLNNRQKNYQQKILKGLTKTFIRLI